jgi:lipoate-protein ligase A
MTFHLLHLKSYPIYEQLLLEEALLRSDVRNWCLINEGSTPAVVMGISGKKEELVDCSKLAENNIPLIKRFSGGGTVIVDENTLFITFICQKQMHDFPAYPEPIMKWTEGLYRQALDLPGFSLKENDYVIGHRKFGGNAQYIKKDRWLHHTSLLWDYSKEKMQYLLHPKKTPEYRQGRSHEEFLCRLSESFSHKEQVIDRIIQTMQNRYTIQNVSLDEVLSTNQEQTRQSTQLISFETLSS